MCNPRHGILNQVMPGSNPGTGVVAVAVEVAELGGGTFP
jgi:hypothetical protein